MSSEQSSSAEETQLVAPAVRRRAVLTLVLTIVLDFIGFGMILPVLPYFAEELGASAVLVTALSAVFSVSQFLMAPVLGRLSDRWGRRPIMLISVAGAVVAPVVIGVAESLPLIFLARLISGASKSNMATAQAAISDMIKPSERAKYMGMTGAAIGVGFVLGPTFGGLLAMGGDARIPFFVSGALSFVNLIMVWAWLPETRWLRRDAGIPTVADESTGHARGSTFRQLRALGAGPLTTLLLSTFGVFTAFALMESTFALFNGHVLDWGKAETGLVLGAVGVVMIIVQGGMVGRLAKRFGELRCLVWGILIMGLGMGLLGATPDVFEAAGLTLLNANGEITGLGLTWYLVTSLSMAGGNAFVMANSSALVSLLSTEEEQGVNMGLRESVSALGRILGPVAAGPLFQFVSPGSPMTIGGIIGLLSAFIALRLREPVRGLGNN